MCLLLIGSIFFKNGNAKIVEIYSTDIKVISLIDRSQRIGSWDNESLQFTFQDGESIPYKMFKALYRVKNMIGDRKPRMKHIDESVKLLTIKVKVKSMKGIRKTILVPLEVINRDSGYIYFEPIKGVLKWCKCDLYGRIKRSNLIVKEPELIDSEMIAKFKQSIDNLCGHCLGAEPYFDCHICRKGRSGKNKL